MSKSNFFHIEEVHLRYEKRRRLVTLYQGPSLSDKQIQYLKRTLCTSGYYINHKVYGKILCFHGDKRKSLKKYLIDQGITDKDHIKIHGI